MDFQKIHARYNGVVEDEGFLPGWAYDLLILRHNRQVIIRRVDQSEDWKTVSDADFFSEWTIIKKRK